jgi:hypothetical protein
MADTPKSPGTGGNTPKPRSGGGGGQSAKDKSRAASRPVAAKGPKSGKGGNTPKGGGNTPRRGPTTTGGRGPSGSRTGVYIAWGAVGLVIVVIAALFIVNATKSNTQNLSYTPVTAAPTQVVHDVTTIPTSTWNAVGVSSDQVSKPTVVPDQPPMTLNGKSPAMLYYGAEYCPYCAAERWAMAAALARFGTWSNLQVTASSHTDVDADTHTFSFHGASLDSPYITFVGVEQYTNVPLADGSGYTNLQNPTKEEAKILTKYSSSKYLPTNQSSSDGSISFPFVDINNGLLFSGASYDPQILAGLSWTDISGGLSDPTNPVTQVILTTGNYMSAGICHATHGQPGSVCTSSGVEAAAKALGISAS